jgi:GxxExxY protein
MNRDSNTSHRHLVHVELSSRIIGCFFTVYNELGPGFLEVIYARAMEIVLKELGARVNREFPIPIDFRGHQIGFQRCDMIIDEKIIVEIKATDLLPPIAERQLRSYLAATKLELGLLLHFGPKARFIPVVPGARQRERAEGPH